ncbi:MAG: Copper ion binding protein, putative [Clostridia bacterium 41_269]|nr:MAG: Copper ion binding protein, putative [Clostridia bacterium 41_269]
MPKLELKVEGMACSHCKRAVEEALKTLEGVTSVEADLDSGKVYVFYEGDEMDLNSLKEAVKSAGYEVVE